MSSVDEPRGSGSAFFNCLTAAVSAFRTHKRHAESATLPMLAVVLYVVYLGGCAEWGTLLAVPVSTASRPIAYGFAILSVVTAAASLLSAAVALGGRWAAWYSVVADEGKWYALVAVAVDAVVDDVLVATAAVTVGALLLAHSLGAAGSVSLNHAAVNIVVVPTLQLAFRGTSAPAATVGVAACFAAGLGSAVATGATADVVGTVVGVYLALFAIVLEIERAAYREFSAHASRSEDTVRHRRLKEELEKQSTTTAQLELNIQLVRYVNDEIRTPLHFASLGLEVLRGQVRAWLQMCSPIMPPF